ncbi:hypothetical protein U1Q18_012863 [Sarracenia purpurea var. burkii]
MEGIYKPLQTLKRKGICNSDRIYASISLSDYAILGCLPSSGKRGGFELPTRLSVAAADCILSLTTALTKKDLVSKGSDDGSKPSNSKFSSLQITLLPAEKKVKPTSSSPEVLNHMEMKFSLWDHLDDLIILVQKLLAVLMGGVLIPGVDKEAPVSNDLGDYPLPGKADFVYFIIYEGGCNYCILPILYRMGYCRRREWAGSQMLKTGVLLLSSCWKHYGMLMHLEDYNSSQHYKELMDQYLSGIQGYWVGLGLKGWARASVPSGLFLESAIDVLGCSAMEVGMAVEYLAVLVVAVTIGEDKQAVMAERNRNRFYAGNCTDDQTENNESGIETIKFFLNCLALLLGHFDGKQFASAMSEDGLQISRVLISQLHSADEDVIDGVVSILKAVIFRARFSLAGSSETDTRDMDAVLPLLLHLLDERDGTARAVVMLLAEYCSLCAFLFSPFCNCVNYSHSKLLLSSNLTASYLFTRSTDNRCLQEVLKRLASADVSRRRNAIDVISELFRISPDPINIYCRQDIANHLLERLGDEESVIRAQASNLIPIMAIVINKKVIDNVVSTTRLA